MMIKEKTLVKIVIGLGIFVVAVFFVDLKRKQPRTDEAVSTWPNFIVKDVTGREIRGKDYNRRIRYVQFVGIVDDNNLDLLKQVYSQWADNINMFIFLNNYRLFRDRLTGAFPKAIFIEDQYDGISKIFKSNKYGKHYVFDKSGINLFSSENNVRYESGIKRFLNLAINNKQFRISELIRENEQIDNLPEFGQVNKAFNEMGRKYLIVGMISTFCESCSSGALVNALGRMNLQAGGKGSVFLILSNEYKETDIEAFKSQLHIKYPIILADKVLSRRWKELTNVYSKTELNNIVFSIDQSGKIDKVLEPMCGPCERPFWEEVIRRIK